MEKRGNDIVNEFEDATFVAFLSLRGHRVNPHKTSNGRVVFEVIGDITKDVESYHLNQKVGILDYVRILKSLRGTIFNLKAMRKS